MLWSLLLTLFTSVFRGPVDSEIPYEVTPYGPQIWEEADEAARALYGQGGDILYPEDDGRSYAGIKGDEFRWPNKRMPYALTDGVKKNKELVELIEETVKYINSFNCVEIVKRTNETKYVSIQNEQNRCYSYVGCVPDQPQPLSLGKGCEKKGTVIHEFLHALGLYHMHQESDRDDYIIINRRNVIPGQQHNFDKIEAQEEMRFGLKYNYSSIMHYGNYAYSMSRARGMKTMVAKDGTELLDPYERTEAHPDDIELLRKMYDCS